MRYVQRGALAAVAALLAACPAGQPPMPAEAPAAVAVGAMAGSTRFDVDPLRGAAFEQAADAGPTGPLVITATEVHHDPATGQTAVTLTVPAPDAQVGDLTLSVDADRPLAAPAPATLPAAGRAARLTTLWFDNPDASTFSLGVRLTGQVAPGRHVAAVGAITATASSSLAGFAPARAVDGDPMTQWTNATYHEASASLTLDLGTVQAVSALKLKMRPFSGGASYAIETSLDGSTYTPASTGLRNTTWSVETKALPAGTQARFVRIRCTNDPASPEVRFEVYDAGVTATAAPGTPMPTPVPVGTPTPLPTPLPPATGSLLETFEGVPLGSAPSTFVDPLDEGFAFSWMPRVRWHVENQGGSKQFLHDGLNTQAVLSFRRYRGTAFGANGVLPARYFAQVAVTPLKTLTLPPTGDQGTQVYYLNPTHYVEVLIKPTLFEVWQCNNGQPFSSAGWSRLYFTSSTTASGQRRVLGATVNTGTHQLTAFLDGVQKTTLTAALIQATPHWLALRGTGNVVAHDDLRIEPR
ncbi:MAG: mycodextranase [Cyanobacteria bacterium RYN_339]|nr:mycodextranase [Cyanobacteria bacterium RYN_339]